MLATNVAETSLTVPGIRYVDRPGHRADLPVQPSHQGAAAADRADQPGLGPAAVGPVRAARPTGIAIRLYTEDDFDGRPEFTDPEILRTNLASVLLQMAALDLGDVADFPFVDPPDRRAVADGVALLRGARRARRATGSSPTTGRALAALPLDPRMARMVRRGRPARGARRGAGHRRRR